MASSINASTTAGVVTTADTSGVLNIQTAGTTAISIDASQAVSFTNAPTVTGGTANGVAYLNGSKVLTTGSALVFDGSNLGVGVTPSAWGGTSKALQLPAGSFESRGSTITTAQNAYFNGTNWIYSSTAGASLYAQNAGIHYFYNAASGTAGNAITFTQAMTLDASGNLAIGHTTSFGVRLYAGSANGTSYGSTAQLRLSGRSANNLASILFTDDNTSDGRISYAPNSTAASRYFSFSARGTESDMILDGSGNLLVGTTNTNPAGSGVTGVVIGPTGAIKQSSGSGASYFAVTGTSGTHIQFYTYNAGAVAAGLISSNGSTTSYTGASDYRLKENIAPMTGALAKVAQLNPVTYKWKLDGSDGQGFIAHELQTIFPDAVVGEKDAVNEDGSIKPQGIDTSFLVATLTAAIQEMKALIDTQASTITQLQADVALLKGATP